MRIGSSDVPMRADATGLAEDEEDHQVWPVRVGEEQIRCARRGLDRFWFGSSVGFRLTRAFLVRCCGPLSEFISSRRLGKWTSRMWGYRAWRICALFAHVDRCEMRRCCRPNGFACPSIRAVRVSPVYMCSSVAPQNGEADRVKTRCISIFIRS